MASMRNRAAKAQLQSPGFTAPFPPAAGPGPGDAERAEEDRWPGGNPPAIKARDIVESPRRPQCKALMTLSSSDLACPEKRLLVCCARTRAEPRMAQEIRQLAAGPLDWDFLL